MFTINLKHISIILCFLTGILNAFSQNIELSNGIGKINHNFTYRKGDNALGTPDSIYYYNPKNQNPVSKKLAYSELYYDNNKFIIRYSYFMHDTLTKKTKSPSIEILYGSSMTLNGDSISKINSIMVLEKYGTPNHILKDEDDMIIDYKFKEKKKFSLLTFYFDANGIIEKIRINVGKY